MTAVGKGKGDRDLYPAEESLITAVRSSLEMHSNEAEAILWALTFLSVREICRRAIERMVVSVVTHSEKIIMVTINSASEKPFLLK